jgi:SAM-dependent methyltransferase
VINGRSRIEAEWFERLYTADEDPWRFETSRYEAGKYQCTLQALQGRKFARALEVGCSIGVFTGRLAEQSDRLVAIDVSERALALAAARLADVAQVRLRCAAFPEQMPDGPWDLIVCSEVLYYLDRPALEVSVTRLEEVLHAGGSVLAVHWRAATRTYPFRGDEVHELLRHRLGRWHSLDARSPDYRLDRFDGEGSDPSVPSPARSSAA